MPPRRGHAAQADPVTTPTRDGRNRITGPIPPFMLQTPPHAPFITTPTDLRRSDRQPMPPSGFGMSNTTPVVDSSMVDQDDEEGSEDEEDIEDILTSDRQEMEDAKALAGLRDINALATWTLSSSKPGCGLAQLRHPSPGQFWQSDGPQPHTLTLHFFKLVSIVKMRIYLDFELDESYTPTKMRFFAGMSEHGLVEFGSWEAGETDPNTHEGGIENVRGWLEIPLQGAGGRETSFTQKMRGSAPRLKKVSEARRQEIRRRKQATFMKQVGMDPNNLSQYDEDEVPSLEEFSSSEDERTSESETAVAGGDILKAMVVQIQICENHQNGKDTHVRGFQVFARDERAATAVGTGDALGQQKGAGAAAESRDGDSIAIGAGVKGMGNAPSKSTKGRLWTPEEIAELFRGRIAEDGGIGSGGTAADAAREKATAEKEEDTGLVFGIREADWMGEPEIR